MKKLRLLLAGCALWTGYMLPAQSHAEDTYSDDVAIIIGNRTYEDQDIPQVLYAHNDAEAVRRFATEVLHIRAENIIYLEDATQAKMQSTFGRRGNHRGKAFQYVKPGKSNLYVFYSGHGIPGLHDTKSYLLPVDAEIETAEINGYPVDLLYENLRQVDAKSVTVMLDACFSGNSPGGQLVKRASGATILPATPAVQNNQTTTGTPLTILTAASKDQLASWDDEAKHGLFTEYLLRALYGEADMDKDGQVRLAEVEKFLNEDMRYKARRTYNRDQTPQVMGDDNQIMVAAVDGIFPTRPQSDQPESYEEKKISLPDPVDPAVINTDDYNLYPVEQNMFAIKNANVRSQPNVRARKVMTLPKGEPIHVAAKIIDQPWYAVERGDGIIGFVFSDLLGEEKEIATEEENRSIRELKARLEKLEEQTKLSTKDILPQPANDDIQDEAEAEAEIDELAPSPQDSPLSYDELENTLKSMGAILARQGMIKNYNFQTAKTDLQYNWIRVNAERCRIAASLTLHHTNPFGKNVDLYDRQISSGFWDELDTRKRTLRVQDSHGDIRYKTTLYQYGPFVFSSRSDRRDFSQMAKSLTKTCPPPPAQSWAPDQKENEPQRKPRPAFKRADRPAPPPFRQPPPPPRR